MNQKTKSKKPRNKKKQKNKKNKIWKKSEKISFFSDMQKKYENFRISKKKSEKFRKHLNKFRF